MNIYKITNTVNGKLYVGCTSQTIENRFRQHQNCALNNKNNGYNETDGGEGTIGSKHSNHIWLGRKHRPESIEKMKATKRKMVANGWSPGSHSKSPEQCKAISERRKGKVAWAYNYLVTFPDGHQESVYNMTEFCKKHGLSKGNMSMVASGKLPHTKQFKCVKIQEGNA
jgi:hypothetical protein